MLNTTMSLRRLIKTSAGILLAGALAMGAVVPAQALGSIPIETASVQIAQAAAATQVKTNNNLNLRSSSNATSKVLLTIPKNKTLTVKGTASNGWYQVTYNKKTGWISNKYVTVTKRATSANSNVKVWVIPTVKLNIRNGAGTKYASVGSISKGQPALASSKASNGWYKITTKGRTGWISGQYVKTCSKGCEIDAGKYTTNRAGLSDRYFTNASGSDLYYSVNGKKKMGDIPKNSVVYRDLKWEKKAGQVSGWYYVRTQGADGWMKASALKRTTNAKTSNTSKVTRAQVLKVANGKIPESKLVAIPWDSEKTLIAAPALADLTDLNTAFKKRFGKNLDIDLAYRTLETQKYFYAELGSYIAAKPGQSNHGWGMAIDVPESTDYSFKGKYYKWLKANSKKYHWIHRTNLDEFRADGSKNPYAEAWHFEYAGK